MKRWGIWFISQQRGEYTLVVVCKACKHRGELVPAELADRFGPAATINEVAEHFYCGECEGRDFWIWADDAMPPRTLESCVTPHPSKKRLHKYS